MGNWFTNLFGAKSDPVGKNLLALVGTSAVWTPADYRNLAREGFEKNVYVYSAIREISMAMAGIPFILFQQASDGSRRRIPSHPILDLLKSPNPNVGYVSFIETVTGYHLLSGNSYIAGVGPKGGPPKELWPLRPDYMKVIPGNNADPIGGYEYDQGGVITRFSKEEILHISSFNPTSDWYGFSSISAAAQSIDASNAARQWNFSMLANSGRPSGVFTFEGELTDKQMERLKSEVQSKVEGASNAGKIRILEGGAKWTPTAQTPLEADWLGGTVQCAREIAIAFNIPPQLLGDTESTTYSNYREARRAFYLENIMPRMDLYRDELNRWIIPQFGDSSLMLDYDRDEIEAIGADRAMLTDMATKAYTQGLVSKGEARQMIGFSSDVEQADQFVLPLNLTPEGSDIPLGMDDRGKSKAFNLETGEQKITHWKSFISQRDKWEDVVLKQLIKRRQDDVSLIMDRVKGSKTTTEIESRTQEGMKEVEDAWAVFLKAVYLTVGQPFAEDVFANTPKSMGIVSNTKVHSFDDLNLGDLDAVGPYPDMFAKWVESAEQYFAVYGMSHVVDITATTMKGLTQYFSDAFLAGKSVEEIEDELADIIGLTEKQVKKAGGMTAEEAAAIRPKQHASRMNAIARTETGIAANFANSEGADILATTHKLKLKKQWLSAQDWRTRDFNKPNVELFDHRSMNGKTVEKNKPYEVPSLRRGLEPLMFPMDPKGSPANIINCRCSEVFITEK